MKQSRWINKLSICERCCQRRELLVDLTNLIQFYLLGILSFCFVNSCQFVILIVSSLFVIRIWIYLYGTWLRDMFHFYYSLVFTKSVNSTFGEFWLAPATRKILRYSLFCDRSQDGVLPRGILGRGNLSDKWSSLTNEYQESDYLLPVGVYW